MGKTVELIKMADNYNGYIITMNQNSCDDIIELAKKHKCRINFPLTYEDLISGRFYGKGVNKFYIDNADYLIQYLAKGISIAAITLNKE